MKKLILKIVHQNWGLRGPESWESTNWNIYDDLSLDVAINYGDEIYNSKEKTQISKKDYENILKQIELSEFENVVVRACDGDAWEIILYENEREVWKREMDYIYGIKPLEKVAKILNKYE